MSSREIIEIKSGRMSSSPATDDGGEKEEEEERRPKKEETEETGDILPWVIRVTRVVVVINADIS